MAPIYAVVRAVDLGLYGLILFGFWRHRKEFLLSATSERMLKVGFGLLVLTGAYSSIEILATDAPGGPRVFVVTVPLLFLAASLHLDVPGKVKVWYQRKTRRG